MESRGSEIRRSVVSGRGVIVGSIFSVCVAGVCGVIMVFVEGMGYFVKFVKPIDLKWLKMGSSINRCMNECVYLVNGHMLYRT